MLAERRVDVAAVEEGAVERGGVGVAELAPALGRLGLDTERVRDDLVLKALDALEVDLEDARARDERRPHGRDDVEVSVSVILKAVRVDAPRGRVQATPGRRLPVDPQDIRREVPRGLVAGAQRLRLRDEVHMPGADLVRDVRLPVPRARAKVAVAGALAGN